MGFFKRYKRDATPRGWELADKDELIAEKENRERELDLRKVRNDD